MRWSLLALVASCGFTPTLAGDGGSGEGTVCGTFSSFANTCELTDGRDADLVITGNSSYDTDANALRIDGGAPQTLPGTVVNGPENIRVVVGRNITITGTLTVTGTFPLALVAFGDARVDGRIDLSKGGGGARNDPDCVAAGTMGGTGTNDTAPGMNSGGGGGGGAAFNGAGGSGSTGDTDDGSSPFGSGGTKLALPTTLLGGCSGGKGGDGVVGTGADGGKGGGAITIAAAGTITIGVSGSVAVNGGGGQGGRPSGGGAGGGGAGGMIVLEAPTLNHAGILLANGGAGAEGGDDNSTGDNGDDGRFDAMRAKGGSGLSGEGGNGGDGGAGTMLDGNTTTDAKHGGGGGGGGGVGFIAIKTPQLLGAGMFSPPLTQWP